MGNIVVEKVWLTDTAVWIRTADGRESEIEICHAGAACKFYIKQRWHPLGGDR